MEWWGLYEDDELIAVQRFRFIGDGPPSIFDFHAVIFSECEYEIWRVHISRA